MAMAQAIRVPKNSHKNDHWDSGKPSIYGDQSFWPITTWLVFASPVKMAILGYTREVSEWLRGWSGCSSLRGAGKQGLITGGGVNSWCLRLHETCHLTRLHLSQWDDWYSYVKSSGGFLNKCWKLSWEPAWAVSSKHVAMVAWARSAGLMGSISSQNQWRIVKNSEDVHFESHQSWRFLSPNSIPTSKGSDRFKRPRLFFFGLSAGSVTVCGDSAASAVAGAMAEKFEVDLTQPGIGDAVKFEINLPQAGKSRGNKVGATWKMGS